MMACCIAWCVGFSACVGGGPHRDLPVFAVADVNRTWLVATQRQLLEQLEMLTSAYNLDDATRQVLIQELQRRLEEEVGYQRSTNVELEALNKQSQEPGAGQEAMDALMAKLRETIENAPLNEDRVAAWLEEQLDPDVLPEGRKRLQELRFRRQRKREVMQEDALERSKTRKMLAREARRCQARLTEQGHPMPSRLQVQEPPRLSEDGKIVRPGRGVTRRESRSVPATDSLGQSALKCAPLSLAEWDRFVRAALSEANATSAEADACRALLASFSEKANQYVQDNAELFQTLASSPTREAYQTRLAELQQGTPINAYFAELKLRIADVLRR